jgi:hypothetical protein
VKQQRSEPRTQIRQSPPQRSNEHLPDAFPERERDRYVSRGLAYVVLLNGVAALVLVAALAFAPQSTADPHRLAWAMMVFGSGAILGLLSSLLAYISRTVSYLVLRDLLRVGAIIAAVGSGAAFVTALNMMALTVPESASTHPKSKPQDQTPAPTALANGPAEQRRVQPFRRVGSQPGGHAALYTGEIAARYPPDLKIIGVAEASPATNLVELFDADASTEQDLLAMTVVSWTRLENIPVTNVVEPAAMPAFEQTARDCIESVAEFEAIEKAKAHGS